MNTRTRRKSVSFAKPFAFAGIGRILPAGSYEVATDEELVEGLSFPVYRRVATLMLVPAFSHQGSSTEMVSVSANELAAALERDLLETETGA